MKLFKKSVSKNNEITIEGPGCGCLIVGVVLSIIFAILFFTVFGTLSILGFEYDSHSTVLTFFVFYFILNSIAELITGALTKLFSMLNIANKTVCDVLYVFLDVITTVMVFGFLDYVFEGIEISFLIALLYALISGVGGYLIEKRLDKL